MTDENDFKKFAEIDKHRYRKKLKPMTYIIGARCKDGVVLVGDRKVSSGETPRFTNKIRTMGVNSIFIFTAAGYESLFEDFLEDVQRKGFEQFERKRLYNENRPKGMPERQVTITDFKHICVNALKKMKKTYSELKPEEALEVLFAIPLTISTKGVDRYNLFYMNLEDCYPQSCADGELIPIGISDIGNIFLKHFRKKPDFTMKEVAKIGSFIIKYVETEDLAEGYIGIGDNQPQILFCKDGEFPKEITGKELETLLEGVNGEVVNVRKKIGSVSTLLRD